MVLGSMVVVGLRDEVSGAGDLGTWVSSGGEKAFRISSDCRRHESVDRDRGRVRQEKLHKIAIK